jgi:outer membrane lipoprotein-sorting protein
MRLKIAVFILICATAGFAQAADVDSTLKALQDIGKNLKEFSADIRLTADDGLGNARIKAGKVFFQRTADSSARIHVLFDKRISNGKSTPGEKTEYLLDGPVLIDRNYRTKNEAKNDVLAKGQKLDLFKIGKGPFPLPIGQDPAEVQQAFSVTLISLGKNEPVKSTHLALTPKAGTPLEKKFKVIDIWVDDNSHMPVRVDTVDKEGNLQSTELSKLVLNPPGDLKETDFKLPDIDGTWSKSVGSYHD